MVFCTPKNVDDDYAVLRVACKLNAKVLSNDRYTDHQSDKTISICDKETGKHTLVTLVEWLK